MSVDAPRPDWTTATLGSLGNFLRGRGGTKADVRAAGVPCIRYGDLYTQHNDIIRGIESFIAPERAAAYTSLQVGDVVFAGSGETHEEIGKAAAFLGPAPAVVGADTIIFRPGSRLHPAYLGYAANATRASRYKARLGQGSSVIHIGTVQLKELSLDLPPLPEQRRIAEILDTLDEAIRKTEQVIAKLQQMKQGLLHDLLTRGIDEDGELRDPERHPEEFKDSPLGRIPRGWEVRRVDALGDVQLGRQRAPSAATGPNQTPYLRVANVYDGFIDYSDVLSMSFSEAERRVFYLRPGDILLNEGQSLELVGRSAIYDGPLDTYCIQNTLVRFRCGDAVVPSFARAMFKRWMDTGKFTQIAKQTTSIAHLGAGRFAGLDMAYPPLPEQRRIARTLDAQQAGIDNEAAELDKLRTLKHGLMDDLLTGRVRVAVPDEAA